MKFFNERTKKLVVVSLLIISIFDTALTTEVAVAADVTSGTVLNQVNGAYGADLKNVTGATVTTDYTSANITNTAQNSILNWNSLNTAPAQSLHYIMTDGMMSLNNVVGTGLSQFAGALTSTGGRVIIANPNGIIFENGSYTNVNALTLTTHRATLDNAGNLTLDGALSTGSKGILIGGYGKSSYATVMRVANDLNIISNGIKIENADVLAGNVRLVTADGVNFYSTAQATPVITNGTNKNVLTFETTNNDGASILSSILVKGSAIAVSDDTNGKIYFITKDGNVNSNISAIDSALDGKVALDVAGNADFEVIGNLDISGINKGTETSKVGGNLIAKTIDKTLRLANNKAFYGLTTTTTTLKDYITSTYGSFTIENVEKFLKANTNGTSIDGVSSSLVSSVYNNASSMAWTTTTPLYNRNTVTTYAGKGTINLANTRVTGDATVNGAGVFLYNLSANNLDVTSTSGTSATTSRTSTDRELAKTTQYAWNGIYTTTTVPVYGYVWQNNGGKSYVLSYNGDNSVWNGSTWTSLSTGKTVDLNLKIDNGKFYTLVTKTDSYWVHDGFLKGHWETKEYTYSIPVMYDKVVNKRWEVDEYHGILAKVFGLSAGDAIDALKGASNTSYTNAQPTIAAEKAQGQTIGNYTSDRK